MTLICASTRAESLVFGIMADLYSAKIWIVALRKPGQLSRLFRSVNDPLGSPDSILPV